MAAVYDRPTVVGPTQMRNINTNRNGNELPEKAREFFRMDPGSFIRVARRLGKSRSHISKVASGQRTSQRVRLALIREAMRLARLHGYRVALELEEAAKSKMSARDLEETARR
jgi:transcriptional regulator with XRE-family HTH domain